VPSGQRDEQAVPYDVKGGDAQEQKCVSQCVKGHTLDSSRNILVFGDCKNVSLQPTKRAVSGR